MRAVPTTSIAMICSTVAWTGDTPCGVHDATDRTDLGSSTRQRGDVDGRGDVGAHRLHTMAERFESYCGLGELPLAEVGEHDDPARADAARDRLAHAARARHHDDVGRRRLGGGGRGHRVSLPQGRVTAPEWRSPPAPRTISVMFTSIVVGTDGSESASVAVQRAAELAALTSATLHIVYGCRTIMLGNAAMAATTGAPVIDVEEVNRSIVLEGEQVCEHAAAHAPESIDEVRCRERWGKVADHGRRGEATCW